MAYALVITDQARDDLADIMAYIAADKPNRAVRYTEQLLDAIRTLANMPSRCPLAAESGMLGYKIRHLLHDSYRILFMVQRKQVIILRIIHGSRVYAT